MLKYVFLVYTMILCLMHRMKHLVIILLLISSFCNSFSETKNYYNYSFQYYTTDNGLTHNMVDCLMKDSRGFLWIGTWDGLNRFDGYDFKEFKHSDGKKGISGNFIYSLCEDNYGNIWIGNNRGLDFYNYENNEFKLVKLGIDSLLSQRVVKIIKTHDNDLWICGDKFIIKIRIDKDGNILEKDDNPELTEILNQNNNEINCIYEDQSGGMWIGTDIGLFHYFPAVKQIESFYHNPESENSLVYNEVIELYGDSKGNLWIGTVLGLSRYNPLSSDFINYVYDENVKSILPHNDVTSFVEDKKGNLIIGTLGGLSIVNIKTLETQIIKDVQFSKYGLNNAFVNCLLTDNEGNIWVGTERGGVNRFNTLQKGFDLIFHVPGNNNSLNTKIVNSIYEDQNNIWIGTAGGGLNRINKATDNYFFYTASENDRNSVPNNFISALQKDYDGNLWVGTWGEGIGILKPINVAKGIFNPLRYDPQDNTTLISNFISSFVNDNFGNMWVGTLNGLDCVDAKTMKIKHFRAQWNGVPITEVGCLLFDRYNNLWIGTKKALYKVLPDENGTINTEKCEIKRIVNNPADKNSISGNYVISLLEDQNGNIWAGTYGDGINLLHMSDSKNGNFRFTRFDESQGMCNNIAYCMEEDSNGYLWISTDNGLARFNPTSGKFRNYYMNDGLLSNQFYWGSSYKSRYGKIYFGGMNGLVSFVPTEVYENIIPLTAQLTEFRLANREVKVNEEYFGKISLTQNICLEDKIKIPYQIKEFSLEFSSLNFTQPEKNFYKYKLEPFDTDWVLVNYKRRKATYMNLKPGTYTFSVMVSNNDLIFNNEPRKLTVVVLAPFYRTSAFQIVTIVFLVFIVLMIIRFRTNNLKRQKDQLEKIVAARTLKIEEQNEELKIQTENLQSNNSLLEERQELIEIQKKEIENHNNQLEELVRKRTTELIKAKNKAEESDRLKTAFLANMSHEIRTPMNAIVGFSSLLNDTDLTNDERANLISMINSSSESLLHLIDDILDLSMIESNQLKIKFSSCNLNGLIDNVHSAMVLINRNPGLEIRLNNNLRDENLEINSDVYRLKQVLLNLMNNALKFTDRGYIELGVMKNDEQLSFFVKDTGRGISPEELDIIFERFRKVEDDKNKLYRGAGLGLSISKRLSELLGGSLRVESNRDKGSTFYFDLPFDFVKETVDQKKEQKEKKVNNNQYSGKKILIVEDEYSNFIYLETALKSWNIVTFWAKDGEEAIAQISKNKSIDVVLMDINMPKLNGIDALKLIKEKNKNIIVIAQTAFARYEDESRIRSLGFDDFLGKPIKVKELIRICDKYLKNNK